MYCYNQENLSIEYKARVIFNLYHACNQIMGSFCVRFYQILKLDLKKKWMWIYENLFFFGLQEPSTPSPTLLSPSRLKTLEEVLSRNREMTGEPATSPVGDFSAAHKSPFRKARRHFKNFVGGNVCLKFV